MNKNKTVYKLLQILSDGRFHSGQKLASQLGMTRSGIWKATKQLRELNIEVHAITGKGYRIPDGIESLDELSIRQVFNQTTKNTLNNLTLLTDIPSTNDYLLELAKKRSPQTIAVFAEHQSAGRGRSGRQWASSYGSSIYHSLLWHFNKDPSELVGLSLAIGIGVIRTLQQYGISKGLQLKWPNDILYNNRKLAGILIDLQAEPHDKCTTVIGVGINVNIPYHFGKKINQPWTDVATITQQTTQKNTLAGLLINELISTLTLFEQQGLSAFLNTWTQYDCLLGKAVTVHTSTGKIHGIMQGISQTGQLRLTLPDNTVMQFSSGEVSLRAKQTDE